MQVLVVGTTPSGVEPAVTQLEAAGHTVARCHEAGADAFPCQALSESGTCPLEGPPIDVVVTVRNHAWPRPSPFEDGALCALRRQIPLVVAGVTALQPFERWSPRTVEKGEDLAQVCVESATAPLPQHGAAARRAAADVLAVAGCPEDVDATVVRRLGALHAEIKIPASQLDLSGTVAARVVGALRSLDPFAAAIDAAMVPTP